VGWTRDLRSGGQGGTGCLERCRGSPEGRMRPELGKQLFTWLRVLGFGVMFSGPNSHHLDKW
jgi:hypothetical protein